MVAAKTPDNRDRDERIMQLFIAAGGYGQIAKAVGVDEDTVHEVVCEKLAATDKRRHVLTEYRYAINLERTEALLKAHLPAAMRGDHRSGELCRRILERQMSFDAPVTLEGDAVDEISARRAARRAGTASGASRTKRPG